MTDFSSRVLRHERAGATLILLIDRFGQRNSMNRQLVHEIRQALTAADRDPEIGAVVLTGDGGGFCAGSDLRFLAQLELPDVGAFEQECADLGRLMVTSATPIVGAVEGFAIGGGLTLAACCDIVVAGRNSRWSMPEVPLGWLTPWGLKPLAERVGHVKARQLCFCLEELSGEQCATIGLVDYVVDDGDVHSKALEIAQKLAALPLPAVRATKRLFSGLMVREAETIDIEANRLFLENCREPAARATLEAQRARAAA